MSCSYGQYLKVFFDHFNRIFTAQSENRFGRTVESTYQGHIVSKVNRIVLSYVILLELNCPICGFSLFFLFLLYSAG